MQYGHARLCSIDRRAADAGVSVAKSADGLDVDLGLLDHEKEGDLIRSPPEVFYDKSLPKTIVRKA